MTGFEPQTSEATALPTEPQPLPKCVLWNSQPYLSFCYILFTYSPAHRLGYKTAWQNCSIRGLSYKASTIVNYDSRVVPDLKIPHIMTVDLQITSANCL